MLPWASAHGSRDINPTKPPTGRHEHSCTLFLSPHSGLGPSGVPYPTGSRPWQQPVVPLGLSRTILQAPHVPQFSREAAVRCCHGRQPVK